jgi:ATP-dependent HslUV protease ATP-binding subunit HslU
VTTFSPSPFSPREIVSELDRHIIGHADAKKAVAVALRNRWRRKQTDAAIRDEITPKNILMIGPTGVGKTEIARRLAKLANAPFLKVEATKFTEVGYVGRDVEQIVRDLVEAAILMVRDKNRAGVRAKAEAQAEERLIDALVGATAAQATRESFRKKLRDNELDEREIEIALAESGSPIGFMEIPGQQAPGAFNLGEMLSKAMGNRQKTVKTTVKAAWPNLINEESDKLLDQDSLTLEALQLAENEGIVFLDEIDKVASRQDRGGADVSREGVQRDLLPLIEGTTVSTKYGPVKTDHILFIASGAFHVAKPSDLLPELQGRLPIRVELKALSEDDFRRILSEPEANLIKQNQALMKTEGVTLSFDDGAIAAMAQAAATVNAKVENIGARRLHTVIEKVMEDLSFTAADMSGQSVAIDEAYVKQRLGEIAGDTDLSRYIL